MPYRSTPPTACRDSNTVTVHPIFARSPAQVRPAGPEPTTATFASMQGSSDEDAGTLPFAFSQSAT
jgi:hypothetical protein